MAKFAPVTWLVLIMAASGACTGFVELTELTLEEL